MGPEPVLACLLKVVALSTAFSSHLLHGFSWTGHAPSTSEKALHDLRSHTSGAGMLPPAGGGLA